MALMAGLVVRGDGDTRMMMTMLVRVEVAGVGLARAGLVEMVGPA